MGIYVKANTKTKHQSMGIYVIWLPANLLTSFPIILPLTHPILWYTELLAIPVE